MQTLQNGETTNPTSRLSQRLPFPDELLTPSPEPPAPNPDVTRFRCTHPALSHARPHTPNRAKNQPSQAKPTQTQPSPHRHISERAPINNSPRPALPKAPRRRQGGRANIAPAPPAARLSQTGQQTRQRNPGAVSSSARRSPSDQPTPPAKPKPQGTWSKPCAPPKPAPPRPRSCEWTLASRLAHAPTCLHSSAPGPCHRAACLLTRDHLTRDTKSCPLPASRSHPPRWPARLATALNPPRPALPDMHTQPTHHPQPLLSAALPKGHSNQPATNPTKGTPGASHHRRLFSCHLSPNPTPTTAPTWLARNPQARLCSPSRRAIPFSGHRSVLLARRVTKGSHLPHDAPCWPVHRLVRGSPFQAKLSTLSQRTTARQNNELRTRPDLQGTPTPEARTALERCPPPNAARHALAHTATHHTKPARGPSENLTKRQTSLIDHRLATILFASMPKGPKSVSKAARNDGNHAERRHERNVREVRHPAKTARAHAHPASCRSSSGSFCRACFEVAKITGTQKTVKSRC